jgi:hypothetical protein
MFRSHPIYLRGDTMYGLPKDFDGSSLIGRTLEMVCFNLNQISLHFGDHVMITVEGALTYQSVSGVVQKLSPPVVETNIMQLVGRELVRVVGSPGGTLSLTFDNGHIVECLDTSADYESYRISFGGQMIIV